MKKEETREEKEESMNKKLIYMCQIECSANVSSPKKQKNKKTKKQKKQKKDSCSIYLHIFFIHSVVVVVSHKRTHLKQH